MLESFSSFNEMFLFGTKLKRVGKRVKVIKNEVIKPNVIIHPKSMIGLISLNIKERKAHTVVKTV